MFDDASHMLVVVRMMIARMVDRARVEMVVVRMLVSVDDSFAIVANGFWLFVYFYWGFATTSELQIDSARVYFSWGWLLVAC